MRNVRTTQMSAVLYVLLLAWSASVVRAQDGGNVELQGFRPAVDSRGIITLNSSQTLGRKEISFGLVTAWGKRMLRFDAGDNSYEVNHLVTPTLVGALGLKAGGLDFQLGLSLPFAIMAGDRGPDSDANTPGDPNDDQNFRFSGQGIGDLGVHAKWRIKSNSRGGFGLALVGSLQFPTATRDNSWIGNAGIVPQLQLAVDREVGRLTLVGNVAVRFRPNKGVFRDVPSMSAPNMLPSTGRELSLGHSVPAGFGAKYALVPQRLDVVGEVFGDIPLSGTGYLPVEAVAGLRAYLAKNSFLTIGGGTGLAQTKAGSPSARAFIGIVFEPNVGDRDRDGIKDDVDNCPLDPEDHDEFEDSDGCPDADNDRDGILDSEDQCKNDPEDKDGHDDDDGCPEEEPGDRDGDGLMDDEDACPDEPEDFDQFEDGDGCPDIDNDNDGILDIDDLCRGDDSEHGDSVRENKNGYKDEDGCPDGVRFDPNVDTKLVVFEKILFEFDSAVIQKASYGILNEIADAIRDNPQITLLEIQGHTDERGSDRYNLRLSQARADSVKKHLVRANIAAHRLTAKGYGERAPKVRESNEAAWATNRRVEFVVRSRTP